MRDRIWPRLLIEFEKGARGTSQLPMRRGRPNLRGRESDPARDERRESRPAVANSGRDVSETLLSAVSLSAVPSVGQAVAASIDMFAIDKNGPNYFTDNFSNGLTPSQESRYSVFGAFPSGAESGGVLTLNSDWAAEPTNASGPNLAQQNAQWS